MKAHPSQGLNDIKLVSSASLVQPEDLEVVAPLLSSDSSSAELDVRPAVIASTSTATTLARASVPNFDEPGVAQSPAPVPIKGGEDEVIRVSHVRKIIINTSGGKESLPPKINKVLATLPRCEASKPDTTGTKRLSTNHHNRPATTNHLPCNNLNHRNPSSLNYQEEKMSRRHGSDSSSDEGFRSDSEPMDVIEKSPYEANFDAEKGVELFTRMKQVLKERYSQTVNTEASELFGTTNARCLLKAHGLIEKSGMVYSQEWCKGNIRGNQLGPIPKELLLLCLVSNRFARAQDLLLAGLTRDFEITMTVQEAIQAWNLTASYPKILRVSSKNMQFQSSRRDCYKCAIFVARAYSCYKAFGGKYNIESSLMAKIETCLEMMENHLPDPGVTSKKKRKSGDVSVAASIVQNDVVSDSLDAPKRKRGRPPRNSVPDPVNGSENWDDAASKASMKDGDDDLVPNKPAKKRGKRNSPVFNKARVDLSHDELDDEDDMVPYNPPVRKKGGIDKKCSTTNASKAKSTPTPTEVTRSLSNLLSKFEAQYEAMGEAYKKIGLTLKELKSNIQENRTATEEQIRDELMQEVLDTLSKSWAKR